CHARAPCPSGRPCVTEPALTAHANACRVWGEWRFLGLTRLLPSVHGLAAVGLSGGGTVSGLACTRVARSGPAGLPHAQARWPKEQEIRGLSCSVEVACANRE